VDLRDNSLGAPMGTIQAALVSRKLTKPRSLPNRRLAGERPKENALSPKSDPRESLSLPNRRLAGERPKENALSPKSDPRESLRNSTFMTP
jgi:hypothetical protein